MCFRNFYLVAVIWNNNEHWTHWTLKIFGLTFLFYECRSTSTTEHTILTGMILEISNIFVNSETSTVGIVTAPFFTVLKVQGCSQTYFMDIIAPQTVLVLVLNVCSYRKVWYIDFTLRTISNTIKNISSHLM